MNFNLKSYGFVRYPVNGKMGTGGPGVEIKDNVLEFFYSVFPLNLDQLD